MSIELDDTVRFCSSDLQDTVAVPGLPSFGGTPHMFPPEESRVKDQGSLAIEFCSCFPSQFLDTVKPFLRFAHACISRVVGHLGSLFSHKSHAMYWLT